MNKLSKLNVECLVNMPTLIDAMQDTVTNMQEVLVPYYDKIQQELQVFFDGNKRLKYSFSNKWERGCIYAFSNKYKKHFLSTLAPQMNIISFLEFCKTVRNYQTFFTVEYGYYSDASWNCIAFSIEETSAPGKFINEEFKNSLELKAEFSDKLYFEEGLVEIQLPIGDDFSEASIDKLYAEFREHILTPFIELLKQ